MNHVWLVVTWDDFQERVAGVLKSKSSAYTLKKHLDATGEFHMVVVTSRVVRNTYRDWAKNEIAYSMKKG